MKSKHRPIANHHVLMSDYVNFTNFPYQMPWLHVVCARRLAQSWAAAADADGAAGAAAGGAAGEEEDDSTVKGNEPGGFPLWQLLLVAVLMFLLGRLSVTMTPGAKV